MNIKIFIELLDWMEDCLLDRDLRKCEAIKKAYNHMLSKQYSHHHRFGIIRFWR